MSPLFKPSSNPSNPTSSIFSAQPFNPNTVSGNLGQFSSLFLSTPSASTTSLTQSIKPSSNANAGAEVKASRPKRSFTGVLSESTTRVVVGVENKVFNLHAVLLTETSPFFRKALHGDFKEAHSGTIELPEDDPATFGYFARWLYNENVFGELTNYESFFSLWILADKLLVPDLENELVYHLIHFPPKDAISIEKVSSVYERTTTSAKLRRLVMDLLVKFDLASFTTLAFQDLDRDVLCDMCKALTKKAQGTTVSLDCVSSADYLVDPATVTISGGDPASVSRPEVLQTHESQ